MLKRVTDEMCGLGANGCGYRFPDHPALDTRTVTTATGDASNPLADADGSSSISRVLRLARSSRAVSNRRHDSILMS